MDKRLGLMIKNERLRRNLSQGGLARGICAVSYLSKIENGGVNASEEIVRALLARLELPEPPQQRELARCRRCFARLFDEWLCGMDAGEVYGEALECAELARFGAASDESAVARGILAATGHLSADGVSDEIAALEAGMDPELRALALLCRAELCSDDRPSALELAERSFYVQPSARAAYTAASMCFYMGLADRCAEWAQRGYPAAAESGSVRLMQAITILQGSLCCLKCDTRGAERFYGRALRLGRPSERDLASDVNYNLGATYLETGDNVNAERCLAHAGELEGETGHNVLLHQKLALLYAQTGRRESALEQTARARALLGEAGPDDGRLYGLMLEFCELICCEGERDAERLERILSELCDGCRESFGVGFSRFYGRYLKELYVSQRRYKEALRLEERLKLT